VRGRLVELVAGLPGVVTEDSYGHIAFLLRRKRIAWLFIDHHGDGRLALCVKAPPGELVTVPPWPRRSHDDRESCRATFGRNQAIQVVNGTEIIAQHDRKKIHLEVARSR
jgi:hypothetical protein